MCIRDSARSLRAALALKSCTFVRSFFLLSLLQSFCHLLKTLLKILSASERQKIFKNLVVLGKLSCCDTSIFVICFIFSSNHILVFYFSSPCMKSNSKNKINKLSVICNAPLKEKSLFSWRKKCHALGSLKGHNSFLYTFQKIG